MIKDNISMTSPPPKYPIAYPPILSNDENIIATPRQLKKLPKIAAITDKNR